MYGIQPQQSIPRVSTDYVRQSPGLIEVASIWLLALLIVLAFWGDPTLPEHAVPTVIPLLIALGMFLWFSEPDLKEDRQTKRWLVLLFLIQLIVALSVNLFWWWPHSIDLGGDKHLYERLGWSLAQGGFNYQSIVDLPVQDIGTTVYVGIVYALFGHNPAAVAVTNTLIAALAGLQAYRLAVRYGSVWAARRAAVLWALLPAALLHSSFPSKEILVSFLGMFISNQVEYMLDRSSKLKRGSFWPRLGLVIISLLVFISIRAMLVIPLVTIVVAQCWLRQKSLRSVTNGLLILLVLGVAGIGFFRWRSNTLGRQTLITPLPVTAAYIGRLGFSYGPIESSLTLSTYWNQDWRRAYLIPLRIPLTLYAPFPPIHFSDIYDGGGSLNVWLLMLITPGIIGAFWSKPACVREQVLALAPVWLPVLAVGTALSAGLPFMQWRYAVMAYPYMIILATIGFENWAYTKRFYLPVFFAASMIFGLYFVLKSS